MPYKTSPMVDGDPNSRIMFVLMAPGEEELLEHRPAIGPAGTHLWRTARHFGITRDQCYIVNVIGEWPEAKRGGPSPTQVGAYRDQFEEYVRAFKGEFVCPMGTDALAAYCGFTDGIEAWRGYLVHPSELKTVVVPKTMITQYKSNNKVKGYKKGDPRAVKIKVETRTPIGPNVKWILPMLHPSGVMRSGYKTMPAFTADIRRLRRALDNELYTEESFEEHTNAIPDPVGDAAFVVDLETYPEVLIGLAERGREGNLVACNAPWTKESVEQLEKWMTPSRVFVAHNVQFDLNELAKNGMVWDGSVFDTMFAAYKLQPDLFKGLNQVIPLYLDRRRHKHKADSDLTMYNLEDCKTEYLLYDILREELRSEGMLERFEQVYMPAVKELSRMSREGINVDRTQREQWLAQLAADHAQTLAKWYSISDNCNPRSYGKVGYVLSKKYNIRLPFSPSGNESVKRAALYTAMAMLDPGDPRQEVLNTYISIGKLGRLLSNYAEKPLAPDGKLHPSFLPVSRDSDQDAKSKGLAGTGRIQPVNPAVATLPPVARKIIIPDDPAAQVLVSMDWRQIELRIAMARSGDKALEAVLQDDDPFARICNEFGIDRTRSKNVAYGTIFGGGPRALVNALRQQGYQTTEKECRDLQEQWAAKFPDLWAWRGARMEAVKHVHFVRNPYGSVRYFYNGRGDGPAAVNYDCQGTAAECIWDLIHEAPPLLRALGGRLLLTCHDEAVFCARIDRLDETIRAMRGLMEAERPLIAPGFRVPVGVKVGRSWGDVEPYKG